MSLSEREKAERKKEFVEKVAMSGKRKKKLKDEIDAKIALGAFGTSKTILPNGDTFILTQKNGRSHLSRIPKQIKHLQNKMNNNFEGIIVVDPPSPGFGYLNRRIGKFVGVCKPDHTDSGFFIIECCHCGAEFKTKNPRKKYHSNKCKRDEEAYQRKIKQEANIAHLECPICHEEYVPKSKKSPTCGKGKCRTAFSRNRKKLRN